MQMVTHITGVIEGIDHKIQVWTEKLAETQADLAAQEKMIAEPFAKQAELEQKTARFNEVMAILNPKEEQVIGDTEEESPEEIQYELRSYDKDIWDDIYYPKSKREASAFLRSFANKTSGLKDGEEKNIVVNTADHVYFITANGYLKGNITKVMQISGNEDDVLNQVREFIHETDREAETFDSWSADIQSGTGRNKWNSVGFESSGTAGRVDILDGESSGSDAFGYSWENYGYSSYEELIEAVKSGAMVMDGNGHVIEIVDGKRAVMSPERDSDGLVLSPQQQEYFNDSKVLDENGNLLVVYHSTDADFTVFDRSYLGTFVDGNASSMGMAATAHIGFWFNSADIRKGNLASYLTRTESGYLNIINPFVVGNLSELEKEIYLHNNGSVSEYDIEYGQQEEYATILGENFMRWLKHNGYDGVVVENDEEFGGKSFVAFESNQFKRQSNTNPTKSKDIQHQQRREQLTNRDILAMATSDIRVDDLTEAELDALNIHKKRLNTLYELEDKPILFISCPIPLHFSLHF